MACHALRALHIASLEESTQDGNLSAEDSKPERNKVMRKPMVTRTITGHKITALVANTETEELSTVELMLGRTKGKKATIAEVQSVYKDSDLIKVVSIKSDEPVNKLYGMYEDDFLAQAFEMTTDTRRPITDEN